jgi:hypothetical protein
MFENKLWHAACVVAERCIKSIQPFAVVLRAVADFHSLTAADRTSLIAGAIAATAA